MYLDIKELSRYLNIKPSTLYAWVAQDKIPHVKIHRLIRFKVEEMETWVESFKRDPSPQPSLVFKNKSHGDVDALIARAKREVYNPRQGETRPISSPRKGDNDGIV